MDGSFVVASTSRLAFSIGLHESDTSALRYIEQELGFGNIAIDRNNRANVFKVQYRSGLLALIQLFNGNITLEKVRRCFILFVNGFNLLYRSA